MSENAVALEKLKYGITQRLSQDFLVDVGVERVEEFMVDTIYFLVKVFVWAEEESAQRQDIQYPRDWWQALKERWFPRWLLLKWPVRYTRITLDVKAIYPNFRPAIPNEEMRLSIIRRDMAGLE